MARPKKEDAIAAMEKGGTREGLPPSIKRPSSSSSFLSIFRHSTAKRKSPANARKHQLAKSLLGGCWVRLLAVVGGGKHHNISGG